MRVGDRTKMRAAKYRCKGWVISYIVRQALPILKDCFEGMDLAGRKYASTLGQNVGNTISIRKPARYSV